jgi:hypothetical protein
VCAIWVACVVSVGSENACGVRVVVLWCMGSLCVLGALF